LADDVRIEEQSIAEALKTPSQGASWVVRYRQAHGHFLAMACEARVINDAQGQPSYLLCGLTKQATYPEVERIKVPQSEHILARVGHSVIVTDQAGKIQHWNPSAERLYGWRAVEVMGRSIYEVIPAVWFGPQPENAQALLLAGETLIGEFKIRNRAGKVMDIEVSTAMLFDHDGQPYATVGTSIDVSARRNIQEALTESERKYRLLIDHAPVGVVIHSPEQIEYVNPYAAKMLGGEAADLIGQSITRFLPNESEEASMDQVLELFELGEGHVMASTEDIYDLQGQLKHFLISGVMVPFAGKQAVCSVFTDVTAQRITQKGLTESEAKYRFLFEHTHDLICLHEPDGTYLQVSPASTTLLGYLPEAMVGQDPYSLSHPDDIEQIRRDGHQRAIEGMSNSRVQYRIRHRDGHYLWLDTITDVIMDAETGQVTTLLTASRDITELKALGQQMEELSTLFQAMLRNTDDFIFFKDLDQRFITASQSVLTLLGLTSIDQLVGKRDEEVLDQADSVRFDQMEKMVLQTGEMVQEVQTLRLPSSEEVRYLDNRKYPLRNQAGKLVGLYGVARDITALKEAEESKRLNQQLLAKNKEMEQFAYVASHDLQEPLRTIRNYVDLLVEEYAGVLGEEADLYLAFVSNAAERMANLIMGLLDYSRLGKDPIKSQVDCMELVASVQADLSANIQAKGAIIQVEALPTLQAYALELRQLFQNLISNALKFHQPGAQPMIRIEAHRQGQKWIFSVHDNGIGIEPKYQEKIFKLFQRLHQGYEGTGIGLAHCQKIVELHHGQIWVSSTPQAGSTFFFSIKQP
jgi:PAS domain S-box-containing protein